MDRRGSVAVVARLGVGRKKLQSLCWWGHEPDLGDSPPRCSPGAGMKVVFKKEAFAASKLAARPGSVCVAGVAPDAAAIADVGGGKGTRGEGDRLKPALRAMGL